MNRVFDLTGQVAVVTGTGGRLGPVWSRALLEAGAAVIGIELPQAQASPALQALVAEYGPDRVALYAADVRDRDALLAARDRYLDRFGVPRVLVNNAGIDQPPDAAAQTFRLEEMPGAAFREVLDVNAFGTFLVSQIVGQDMVKAGRGSIVNIASLYAAVAPDPRLYEYLPSDPPFLKPPAYGASKAAVVNLTRYLAAVWGPRGVRVNALSPGGVEADQDETFKAKYADRVPLRRMARPEDLAGPLLFLASDASAYVTGVELRVDGGFTVL